MTCDSFFFLGILAALAALALAIVAFAQPPGFRYALWLVAAFMTLVASLYLTVPWLTGYTHDCIVFNYKLSLANMPPTRVQHIAVGDGANDSYSVRSHTYSVGWFSYRKFRGLRN